MIIAAMLVSLVAGFGFDTALVAQPRGKAKQYTGHIPAGMPVGKYFTLEGDAFFTGDLARDIHERVSNGKRTFLIEGSDDDGHGKDLVLFWREIAGTQMVVENGENAIFIELKGDAKGDARRGPFIEFEAIGDLTIHSKSGKRNGVERDQTFRVVTDFEKGIIRIDALKRHFELPWVPGQRTYHIPRGEPVGTERLDRIYDASYSFPDGVDITLHDDGATITGINFKKRKIADTFSFTVRYHLIPGQTVYPTIPVQPSGTIALADQAETLLSGGDFAGAVQAAKRARAGGVTQHRAFDVIAEEAAKKSSESYSEKKNSEAKQYIADAIYLSPNVSYYHNTLGNILYQEKKYGEASDAYKEAIHIDPRNKTALANLAGSLLKEGKRDEAIAAAKRSIALGKTGHAVFEKLGLE